MKMTRQKLALTNPIDELTMETKRKCEEKNVLDNYQKALVQWDRNIDQNYAWVILFTLWLINFATMGPYRLYGLIFAKITVEGYYTREEASWPVSMIFTVNNIIGAASILIQYISFRKSILIGGLLLVLGNGLCAYSESLITDVILLGILQGIGFGFIFIPLMDVINNYFRKYRNVALGIALCGSTLPASAVAPLFQWFLEENPWRSSYLVLGALCCIIPLMAPLLKPNPRPKPPEIGSTLFNVMASLSNQVALADPVDWFECQHKALGANEVDSRWKKSTVRSLADVTQSNCQSCLDHQKEMLFEHIRSKDSFTGSGSRADLENGSINLKAPNQTNSGSNLSLIWSVVRKPAFHLIWFSELIHYWICSIFILVQVDYGTDHGCSQEEAETLLQFQSIGEIIGRIVLTTLVDMGFLSHKNIVIINLLALALMLSAVTQVSGFIPMAITSVGISATYSLLYVLLNGLLVEHLGENQVTLGYGLASFICGILLIFRPQAVGYFRDNLGSYDPLMFCLAGSCAIAACLWILEPLITKCCTKDRAESA